MTEPAEPREGCCTPKVSPLSVLFFLHSAQLGGAERGLFELVAGLIGDHDAVCTVVCPADGPLISKLQSVGASTLIETKLSWWAGTSEESSNAIQKRVFDGARALLRILPTLQEIDPDIVYTQTITIPWGAAAAALLDKPHYWSICEFGELDHGLRFLDSFADVIEQVKSGASFIRTPSEAVRRTLFPDLGPDRVRTVYRPGPMPSVTKPSTKYFQRTGATRLAIFGKLCEGKGQLDAIQATGNLTARGRDVELLLAGYSDPEYRLKVDALIDQAGVRDRVIISDFLLEPLPTMLAADIILVCSRSEAFGRVVVEAMRLARPVVYARSGGIPEYMEDGVTGLSYAPGNVNELVQRIEELIDDPERATKITGEAKRYACAKFTRDGSDLRILKDLHKLRGRADWRVAMPKRVVAALTSVAKEPRDADIAKLKEGVVFIDRLQDALNSTQKQAIERANKIDLLQKALDNSQELAKERANKIDTLQKALDNIQELAKERANKIDTLQKALDNIQELAKERANKIDTLQKALDNTQELAKERANKIDTLQKALDDTQEFAQTTRR